MTTAGVGHVECHAGQQLLVAGGHSCMPSARQCVLQLVLVAGYPAVYYAEPEAAGLASTHSQEPAAKPV